MIGYRFLLPAEEEMTEASLYYDANSRGLGQEFLDEVQRTIDIARRYPELGRPAGDGIKSIAFGRFPFLLFYAHEPDEVLVVAVAHQKRRPDYWRSRVAGQ